VEAVAEVAAEAVEVAVAEVAVAEAVAEVVEAVEEAEVAVAVAENPRNKVQRTAGAAAEAVAEVVEEVEEAFRRRIPRSLPAPCCHTGPSTGKRFEGSTQRSRLGTVYHWSEARAFPATSRGVPRIR